MTGLPPISDDLKELIALFQFHGVEFMVVGAHALAFHALPRFTQDLDLFVERNQENAARIRAALNEFGIGMGDEGERELYENPRGMIVLGRQPTQVDILNFLDGVEFGEAKVRQVVGAIAAGVEVPILSLEDYVATKRASRRAKDLDDLRALSEYLGREV